MGRRKERKEGRNHRVSHEPNHTREPTNIELGRIFGINSWPNIIQLQSPCLPKFCYTLRLPFECSKLKCRSGTLCNVTAQSPSFLPSHCDWRSRGRRWPQWIFNCCRCEGEREAEGEGEREGVREGAISGLFGGQDAASAAAAADAMDADRLIAFELSRLPNCAI